MLQIAVSLKEAEFLFDQERPNLRRLEEDSWQMQSALMSRATRIVLRPEWPFRHHRSVGT